ncbi:MAG: hypothetical protein AAFU79_37160, partial [Myxococcota bacterium]
PGLRSEGVYREGFGHTLTGTTPSSPASGLLREGSAQALKKTASRRPLNLAHHRSSQALSSGSNLLSSSDKAELL